MRSKEQSPTSCHIRTWAPGQSIKSVKKGISLLFRDERISILKKVLIVLLCDQK